MGTIFAYIRWRLRQSRAEKETQWAPYVPQYATPDLERINDPDPNKIQLTWVGHSTFLIQIAGMNILTDPIWSDRASPVQFAGPRREARPGLAFEDLPKIDAVLVSHTHYDHLDRPTIRRLGNAPRYVIPTGTTKWFAAAGVTNAVELPWWQGARIGAVEVVSVPAKHWSKRTLFGTGGAGWGGHVIESPSGTIYFAGDTGYDPGYFKEIGARFPAIALALIPIGAYYPQWFFGRYHVDPREALVVHKEVGAKKTIGMHWGVFKLTEESLDEPPQELLRHQEGTGIAPEEFSVMEIGETRTV